MTCGLGWCCGFVSGHRLVADTQWRPAVAGRTELSAQRFEGRVCISAAFSRRCHWRR
jgi:hypothetical protein